MSGCADTLAIVGDVRTTVGKADAALDERLTDELDRFNAAATPDVAAAEELTVRIEQDDELIAGRLRLDLGPGRWHRLDVGARGPARHRRRREPAGSVRA